MVPAMPCRTCKKSKKGETRGKTNDFNSKFACILEASESTRLRMEETLPKYYENHTAVKRDNSLQHYNLVHTFIPGPQAMKIHAAKEWEKLEQIPAWDITKVRSKSEVIDEARTKGAKVHFASLMDICHLRNADLETKHQKGRITLRGDIVKDDSGSYAVFTEQGSSASQMTAAKVMDIISRLPGCAGQAADAVSAYTQVKMEDAPKLLKIPKSECPEIWIPFGHVQLSMAARHGNGALTPSWTASALAARANTASVLPANTPPVQQSRTLLPCFFEVEVKLSCARGVLIDAVSTSSPLHMSTPLLRSRLPRRLARAQQHRTRRTQSALPTTTLLATVDGGSLGSPALAVAGAAAAHSAPAHVERE